MEHSCPYCKQKFTISKCLPHVRSQHKNLLLLKFNCPHCERCFNDIYGLHQHLRIFHSKQDKTPEKLGNSVQQTTSKCENPSGVGQPKKRKLSSDQFICQANTISCKSIFSRNSAFDFDLFYEQLFNSVMEFSARLFDDRNLCRSSALELIKNASFLTSTILSKFVPLFKNSQYSSDFTVIREIVERCFSEFSTEYRITEIFKKTSYFIPPSSKTLELRLVSTRRNSKQNLERTKTIKLEIVPMASVLEKILSLPNVLNTILKHVEECKASEDLISPVQGETWKQIESKYEGKIVFPLVIIADDFEINNPLGSHKVVNKVCGVYFSLLGIPNQSAGKLENIFLAQLYKTKDYSRSMNGNIFSHVINQVIKLETEGISLKLRNQQEVQVYFALLSILRDNLGQNSILGFSINFNDDFCCRMCCMKQVEFQKASVENPDLLRTRTNYSKDVRSGDNGVQQECVFNAIPSYHSIDNMSVDITHDILEGGDREVMGKIVHCLIKNDKLLTLDVLNYRMKCFCYNSTYGLNKPPSIKASTLSKKQVSMSAAEMSDFIKFLVFYIGDPVPVENEAWQLYL
uniref:Znf787 protein n=1 Tax=Fopius arisanus TaxID=64838 RepID=A0A0C9QPF5_9HYME